tara:strand:+ start:2999 stop:3934 length:936 start_codon:yes stop_codon:yes gene_type:complete
MNIWDIIKLLIVLGVFMGIFFGNMISVGIQRIKDDWPKHKCNPMVMPFAGYLGYDTMENFTTCVAGIMQVLMDKFLSPVFTTLNIVTQVGGGLMKDISQIKAVMPKMEMQGLNMNLDIKAILTNVVMKVQKMVIQMKDTIMRIAATSRIIMNASAGFSMAGVSYHCGPPGDFVRTFQLKPRPSCCAKGDCGVADVLCFSGNTKIEMNDGKYKKIKDIELGDKLLNDIDVICSMKIKNNGTKFYKIYSKKLKQNIYVTGNHLIQDPESNRFIPVEESSVSKKTNKVDDIVYCLITSNHNIPVGEFIFWDWED